MSRVSRSPVPGSSASRTAGPMSAHANRRMPIMDGRTAANEIRKLESTLKPQPHIDPLRVGGRIAIFAVSASLYESDRGNLARDFDGWLLKPLDFSRVRVMLAALEDPQKRTQELYQQGHWERGGYLRGESCLHGESNHGSSADTPRTLLPPDATGKP